jgi:hypothetical protein
MSADDVDFAGNVAYNKGGSNPQGQVQLFIHSMNKSDGTLDNRPHLYYVKSNSIASLSFTGLSTSTAKTATFSAKTNVYEELGNGSQVGLDGGGTMQLTFTQPGGQYTVTTGTGSNTMTLTCPSASTAPYGCASVVVYKSTGGIWFSNAWGSLAAGSAPQTVEQLLKQGGMAIN